MKLICLSVCGHDHNISYFDGERVRYFKLERKAQEKRAKYNEPYNDWKSDIKELWGVEIEDVDKVAVIGNLFRPESKLIDETVSVLVPDKCWYIDHHYAHSLSVCAMTDETPDVSISIDRFGDGKCFCVVKDDKIIDYLSNNSIGDLILKMGVILGLNKDFNEKQFECYNDQDILDISDKIMDLQSYGTVDLGYYQHLINFSINDSHSMFSFNSWKKYIGDEYVAELRKLDWVKTLHLYIEKVLLDYFSRFASKEDVIFYSGGCAQNVVWNTALKNKFRNLIVAPHCSVEGLSLGGVEWLRRQYGLSKFKLEGYPYCQSDIAPLGIGSVDKAAKLLSEGKVVGWYQGNGEIGPRALGNRSILMDPRIHNAKEIVNKVKKREKYRSFGASVLEEHVNDYFDLEWEDPYMLYTAKVKVDGLNAVTHVDGTCRLQTVNKNDNLLFRSLLERFYELTGCPILLNTSLNLSGRPLAGSPRDALELFRESEIDCVFVGEDIRRKGI